MIYLIITASLVDKLNNRRNLQDRESRYINSITHTLKYVDREKIKPIIVENNGERDTILNTMSCDVVYTTNNFNHYFHKGVNELKDIQDIIRLYNIQDDDVIIKLTGRYKVLDGAFFKTVINNQSNIDAFVKFFNVCTLRYMYDDCVLGMLAIKAKYLRDFTYEGRRSAECEIASMVRKLIATDRLYEMKDLNLECCFADDLRLLIV
jgi:hypothetical protein